MPSVLLEGIMRYIIALFTHYAKAVQEMMVYKYHNTMREFTQGMLVLAPLAKLFSTLLLTFFSQAHPSSTRYIKVTKYLGRMNNSYVRFGGKMFDNGSISMAAKSKEPSQAAMLAYDSNHNTNHYNDASYRRFPELSMACSDTQYELTKSKKQHTSPGLNFDEKFQKPVQLLTFTLNGALPELGHSAGKHIVTAHIPELCISRPLTDPSQAQRFPREVRMYERTRQARPKITAMPQRARLLCPAALCTMIAPSPWRP
jgi:hypothetical protein